MKLYGACALAPHAISFRLGLQLAYHCDMPGLQAVKHAYLDGSIVAAHQSAEITAVWSNPM